MLPVFASMGFPAFLACFFGGIVLFAIFAAYAGQFFDSRPDSEQKQDRIGVGKDR